MQSACGRYAISFNGEIYNFPEIGEKLRHAGISLRTKSDTEVLIEAWSFWGTDILPRLRGMFSFAIVDMQERKLHLVRDHSGKKPLYCFSAPSGLVFSSSIATLLVHPAVPNEIDPSTVYAFLNYRYAPSPHTFFKGVFKTEPGSIVTWQRGLVKTESFPHPSELHPAAKKPEGNRFPQALAEAVAIRMQADGPVGVFLSSGIDSASILAHAVRYSNRDIPAFTVGFVGDGNTEIENAANIARAIGAPHHPVSFDFDTIFTLLEELSLVRGAPLSNPADIAVYVLACEASKHVKVVLSGEGADELLGGYPKYIVEAFLSDRASGLVAPVAKLAQFLTMRSIRGGTRASLLLKVLSEPDFAQRSVIWFGRSSAAERRALWIAEPPEVGNGFPFRKLDGNMTPLRRAMTFDQQSWLRDNLLDRLDSMTMAASIEARAPFLDTHLASVVSGLSDNSLVRGLSTKRRLRQAMTKVLPPEVIQRRKRGFPLPVHDWFKGTLGDAFLDAINRPSAQCTAFLNRRVLEGMLFDLRKKGVHNESVLWSIFALEAFLSALAKRPTT